MNEQRQLADLVLDSLQTGAGVPWRFPHNRLPEFSGLFGKFFTGEPLAEAEVDYSELDAIIKATGARVTHHWRCPKPRCDRPPLDRILLPPRSRFIDDRQYHAVRIHEVIHFVEHPWRAAWVGPPDQGELIAECGTGFVESFLRLPHDTDNTNIAKWLPQWSESIKADPAYLFDAVVQAERSVNHLLDLRRRWAAAWAEHRAGENPNGRKRRPEKDDRKTGPSKRLTRKECDRLVRGADDIFFWGLDEPVGEKASSRETSPDESPMNNDDRK